MDFDRREYFYPIAETFSTRKDQKTDLPPSKHFALWTGNSGEEYVKKDGLPNHPEHKAQIYGLKITQKNH
jgi:hypothetical protein